MAQSHEGFFVELWDRLRADSSKALEIISEPPLLEITLPTFGESTVLDNGVELREAEAGPKRNLAEWRQYLKTWADDGWEMVQSEWHHRRFEKDARGVA